MATEIRIWDRSTREWRIPKANEFPGIVQRIEGANGYANLPFGDMESERNLAIEVAKRFSAENPVLDVRVVDTFNSCFWSFYGTEEITAETSTSQEGTDMTPDITEPLNLNREDVLARLQEHLDNERYEREQRQADLDAGRRLVVEWIENNIDRVAEFFFTTYGGTTEGLLANHLENDVFVGGRYTPKDSVPTAKETDLEKFVRVLGMATDETIKLTPNEPIWDLL